MTTTWGQAWATGGAYVKCIHQRPKIMKIALLTTSIFYNTFTIYESIYTYAHTTLHQLHHTTKLYNTLYFQTLPPAIASNKRLT